MTDEKRQDFLIAMYNQLMNDINRHIVVVWHSIAALFGGFAVLALIEKQVITLDLAVALIVILSIWVVAHVYDAGYWYNRNLVIIANIERQFLLRSDLRDVHYYFGAHRRKGSLLTHLRIQGALAVGVAVLVLLYHAYSVIASKLCSLDGLEIINSLPWLTALIGIVVWFRAKRHADRRYEEFLRQSPGKSVETSGVVDYGGPGHPIDRK